MVAETEITQILADKIGSLTTFIQAIGGLVLIYVIFQVANFIINRKKKKEMVKINHNLEEIKKLLKKKR